MRSSMELLQMFKPLMRGHYGQHQILRAPGAVHGHDARPLGRAVVKSQDKSKLTPNTGWWLGHPSEKYEFVNWDDEIPKICKNKKHGNQTTNQNISGKLLELENLKKSGWSLESLPR